MKQFRIDGVNRKGLLFVNYLGAREFLVWNDKTGVALLGQAYANNTGIDTVQLPTARLKDIKEKLNQLINRGYIVYSTFNFKGCKTEIDYNNLKNIVEELAM
ncbi:MAG: hypothetical protein [Caudoviricetes sp.]|nr:MAG: hypothetical protein [Caudoviricetes sp.]